MRACVRVCDVHLVVFVLDPGCFHRIQHCPHVPPAPVGENAFDFCTNLESVQMPRTLTVIEDYSFYNCSSLDKVSVMPAPRL